MRNRSPNWFKRTLLVRILVASLTLIGLPSLVSAQTALQFNLGWKVEASGGGFLGAPQKGYFKQADLMGK